MLSLAQTLGTGLAEAGYVVLTGGRNRGVMAAACSGAKVRWGQAQDVVHNLGPRMREFGVFYN